MEKSAYFEEYHDDIQDTAQEVANEFQKTAAEADETADYSIVKDNLKRLGELGFLGLFLPEQYGGANGGTLGYVKAAVEIAKGCVSTAFSLNSQIMCSKAILMAGTEEQKKKFLPPLGIENIAAFAATEPEAGSDLASLKTTADLNGDTYLLNGEKHYITNGIIADTIIVFAKTSPSKGARGISAFIVDKNTPGLEMGRVEKKMGVKAAPATQLFFDDAEIPTENLLGEEGEGFKIALQCLDLGRIGLSAMCVGIAKIALKKAVEYATVREQFGKPIVKQQGIRFMIGDIATNIKAMENLTYHAAWLADQGERVTQQAAMAKKFNSQRAVEITDKAIQIFGGAGYTKEYPVERYHRDAKVMTIADGTSEIMNVIIARNTIERIKNSR